MLVFQRNWEEHIKEDGCKRAGIEFKWLVEVVAEINSYLPDDWRLTRSTNNFRIQIVADHSATLVGHGYRTKGDDILNIIDSVHKKEFFDVFDVRKKTGKSKGKIDRSFKRKNPEVLVPNLYFFRPCPANSFSPLFARQYERRKKGKGGAWVGDEYHRIHPLTKAGLDLSHFRWVRWNMNGDVSFVETVDPQYHGQNYWNIKGLKSDKKRTSREVYISKYHQILENEGIIPPQPAERNPSPYEPEYKFFIHGNESDAHTAFGLIPELIEGSDFSINDFDRKAKKQVDTYFDDDNLSLHAVGASFRVRMKKKDNIQTTLKKRRPVSKGFSKEGLYERIEEEAVITSSQEAELIAGKPINAFPYRLLPYIAPDCGKLTPKVKVINNRKVFYIRDEQYRKAELCLDEIRYEIDGVMHGPYFEIEIESKGAPREKIKELADYLEESLGLIPSHQSKYERGISLLKISNTKVPKEKKMVIIDTDCGVDDALALILALRSPELDVKAITTVSGNVHVDHVVPNVFKVMDVLELKNRPLVARGADRPIKKDPIVADSVHGKDGLGDVAHIPKPGNVLVDSRPAWQVICEAARQNPKQITLITIGPMTNLALAIQNDPEGVRSLKKVVSMGGVFFNVGNVGPDAEFNVGADPDATFEVVKFCRDSCKKTPVDRNGKEVILPLKPTKEDYAKITGYQDHDAKDSNMVPLIFIGLDVTHKVLLRRAALERTVRAHPGNDLLKFVQDISKKYMDFYYENERLPGCYLHDPLAVAYVINPSFLKVEQHIIHVETRGESTSGMIFPDDRPTRNVAWRNPAEEVIGIARNVEREAFEEFLLSRLINKQ